MLQLYENIKTDFLVQIFLELFQFKTRGGHFLGHAVYGPMVNARPMDRLTLFISALVEPNFCILFMCISSVLLQ